MVMKVNIFPIVFYCPTQGITGISSDVCLCAPHFSQISINKHNTNNGRETPEQRIHVM